MDFAIIKVGRAQSKALAQGDDKGKSKGKGILGSAPPPPPPSRRAEAGSRDKVRDGLESGVPAPCVPSPRHGVARRSSPCTRGGSRLDTIIALPEMAFKRPHDDSTFAHPCRLGKRLTTYGCKCAEDVILLG